MIYLYPITSYVHALHIKHLVSLYLFWVTWLYKTDQLTSGVGRNDIVISVGKTRAQIIGMGMTWLDYINRIGSIGVRISNYWPTCSSLVIWCSQSDGWSGIFRHNHPCTCLHDGTDYIEYTTNTVHLSCICTVSYLIQEDWS